MAKMTTQGGGSVDDQIKSLEDKVGAKGRKAAQEIVDSYDGLVIKLAFKRIRKNERATGTAGLGSRIETLLKNMPAKQADAMRQSLLAAKKKSKE